MPGMVLERIRVIDATGAWAGPFTTQILGDLGAEVIKVEAIQRIDSWRLFGQIRPTEEGWWERSMNYNSVNRNKYNVTLDLGHPRGAEAFKRLVKIGDLVVENFTPRVMKNFGLDYPVLKEINPSLIMISMPGWGMTGPWKDYTGFAPSVEQLSGLSQLTGYADSGPMPCSSALALADPLGGLNAAFALLIALQHRRQTGRGQHIDLSQNEALSSLLGGAIMDYTLNRRVQGRWGNRHPFMAPHGCYRCRGAVRWDLEAVISSDEEWARLSRSMGNPQWTKEPRLADAVGRRQSGEELERLIEKWSVQRGEDKWVVIAVTSDEEWARLGEAIGSPAWSKEPRFADSQSRWQNQDELDRLIEQWTIQHSHYEAMAILQAAGVAAAPCLSPRELNSDPHLKERGFFEIITRAEVGTHPYPGMFFRMSKTPGRVRMPPPTLGQHNEFVLGVLLGMSQEEIAELAKEKVIGVRPIGV